MLVVAFPEQSVTFSPKPMWTVPASAVKVECIAYFPKCGVHVSAVTV